MADVNVGSSWDAAYGSASLGQALTVAPGDHGSQTITTKTGKTSPGVGPKVTFDGAGQAKVALRLGAGVDDMRAPSHLAFKGISGRSGTELFVAGGNANDILIEGYSANSFYINGAQNFVLKGGVFDPRPSAAPQVPNCKIDRGAPPLNDGIVIDGVEIHNYTFGPTCQGYGGSFDCHGEGLIIFGGKNIVIRNSKLWDNWTYNIFCQWDSGSFPQFGLTVEDCEFGKVTDGRGGVRSTALTLGSDRIANILVQRNQFVAGQYLVDENNAQLTNVRAISNTFSSPAMYVPGIVYDRNVWTSGAQGTDTNGVTPPPDSLPLTITAQTTTTVTVGWTPVPGIGYRFLVDGVVVSHTWDANRSSVKFSKQPGKTLRVEALKLGPTGSVVSP